MNGDKPEFVSLLEILRAIQQRVNLPDEVLKLPGCDESYVIEPRNDNYRWSTAALMLHEHLLGQGNAGNLRWYVCPDGPLKLSPILHQDALPEGMGWLRKQADAYSRWLLKHRAHVTGRATLSDRQEVPRFPDGFENIHDITWPYEGFPHSISEIGFDWDEIVGFLLSARIPNAIVDPTPSAYGTMEDKAQSVLLAGTEGVSLEANDSRDAHRVGGDKTTTPSVWGNQTGRPGRRCLIEDAIECARDQVGDRRYDVDAVRMKLRELAIDRPNDFRRQLGYQDGEIVYWRSGKPVPYTRDALAEYLNRRKKKELSLKTA